MKGIFEIDPDRFLQKSVLDRRCISPCLKPDNDANVPDPKFHYCFTSPWMMKFDKSSDEYFPENQMFSWDMCSHRHCGAKKCSKTKLSWTPCISIKCNIFLYFQVYHTAYGFQCKDKCKKATKPGEAPKVSGNYPYYCTIDEKIESTLSNKIIRGK